VKIETIEEKINSQELLPQIIERIFSICRVDPNFKLKDELEIVENKIKSIKQKIERQDMLLERSATLKKDLLQRLEILNDQNEKKQISLLESLGAEL
jgi:hypothetical protein